MTVYSDAMGMTLLRWIPASHAQNHEEARTPPAHNLSTPRHDLRHESGGKVGVLLHPASLD